MMQAQLYDPARHEPLRALAWDESRVRSAIERIVLETESRYTDQYWPLHPRDRQSDDDTRCVEMSLYDGACGVIWGLNYLEGVRACSLSRSYGAEFDRLLARNRGAIGNSAQRATASFLTGDTPIQMMAFGVERSDELESALAGLIAGNVDHPARELMWGSPGTLLAALFLHERTGDDRWAELFRFTASKLWSQLHWSPQYQCSYWTQDFSGRLFTHLGAVHGFVATALPLIRGRHLLNSETWKAWERCIVHTIERTADRHGAHANWRPYLDRATEKTPKKLLQFCHGAPGFVICLGHLPSTALDDLLLSAGELIWTAGPLIKGSNLCHGTGGNGYAFLRLYQRTRDSLWLERARSFAMHGIAQCETDASHYGQSRYSLWTGDVGFAIYLWDCLRAQAQFPTLDVFYARQSSAPGAAPGTGDGRRSSSR